jgi:hypothetical protein
MCSRKFSVRLFKILRAILFAAGDKPYNDKDYSNDQ